MDSGCPERHEVAAALAHLWRRAPLELLDYVADFACEHEIRLSTGREVRHGTRLLFSSDDDRPWNFLLEGDLLDEEFVGVILLRGQESISLRVPATGHRNWHPNDVRRILIRPRYVVVALLEACSVFRRTDGEFLHSWSPSIASVGSELYVRETSDGTLLLNDLATGDTVDAWQVLASPNSFRSTAVAIDTNDSAVWVPGCNRSPKHPATPSYRVPIVNRRFVRDARSHVYTHRIACYAAVCIRGDWVYIATDRGLIGIHANGTRRNYALNGWDFAPTRIVSTPHTMLLFVSELDRKRQQCSALRFTGADEGKH